MYEIYYICIILHIIHKSAVNILMSKYKQSWMFTNTYTSKVILKLYVICKDNT